MKKIILIPMLLFATVLTTGCSNSDDEDQSKGLRFISVSGCKTKAKANVESRSGYLGMTESFKYEGAKGRYLNIVHQNALYSCGANITADVKIDGQCITITEKGTESGADCICPYDITMKIGPLENQTYRVDVVAYNETYTSFSIEFNQAIKGEHSL